MATVRSRFCIEYDIDWDREGDAILARQLVKEVEAVLNKPAYRLIEACFA